MAILAQLVIKIFGCEHCGSNFSTKSVLEKHIIKNHIEKQKQSDTMEHSIISYFSNDSQKKLQTGVTNNENEEIISQ